MVNRLIHETSPYLIQHSHNPVDWYPWNQDAISGEANYDIDDDDIIRSGDKSLFNEMNIPKKVDVFRKRLVDFLQDFRSNNDLYKFTLENGCLPKHTKEILEELQKKGRLEAKPSDIRKRSFYMNWDNYNKRIIQAYFRVKYEKE